MNPIEPVIKPGDSGPHVSNLQAGIFFLVEHGVIKTYDPPNMPTPDDLKALAEKLRSEQAAQLFGAATQQLLRYFQIQQGLGDRLFGIVDDGTARMLNELLKALGGFESSDLYEVFGTVREVADMRPAPGVLVMAYDQDVARLAPLGEARTDGDGHYRITFGPAAFRATAAERGGAEILVHALNDQGAVIGKSKLVRNAGRRTELSFLVETRCVVRGTVTDQRGTPVAGHKVVAYDQDLRTRQRLGDAQTDARGHYEIPYQHEAALQAEGATSPAPDLVVEVLPHDSVVPLATSPIRFHAKRVETIDLVVNVPDEGPTEFERLTAAIMPLLKGQGASGIGTGTHETPADLSPEDITANDLDFIVLETGLDRTAVHAWAVSSRMVGDAVLRLTDEHAAQQRLLREHGWPFFYALVRQGGEGNLDAVLRNTTSDWQRAWGAARAVNQVSAPDEQRVEELMAVLSLLQRVQQLDPSRAGNSEFVRVLAGAPLPLPVTVALDALAVVQEKGLDDTGSLLKLSERYPEAEAPIKTFVRTVRVHRLAGGQVEFSRVLNGRLEGASDSIEPLARMRAVDWIGMAEEAGVSPGLALQTQAQVEQLHPLTALESKLHAGLFQLPGVLLNEAADLIKNQPAMVENLLLGKVPVKVEETTTQTMLRNTGRFLRTGVSMELAEDLMKKGISSPGVALRYGPEHLRKQYRDTLPAAAVTEVVDRFVRHADGLVEGGKGITIEIDINRRGPSYYRQKDLEEYKVPLPEAVRENAPTLAALFGDLDECICRPCESMLGQPAYLVDLLNLLAKSTGTNGSALDELRSRRPDIFNLKLSCENAEQTIQHVDIVLEILEKAAAREAAPGATADAIRQIAYPKLRQAIYPWHLPFDLGYAAVSAYLAKLGVSRAKLLELQRGAVPAHVASEALHAPMDQAGNSDADSQWELLTQQRLGTRLWAVYGFNIANDIGIIDPASRELLTNQKVQDVLIRVSVLIDRTGLSLEDLEQTLKTAFVSGNSSGIALSGREQCKTSAMRLSAEGPVLEGILDRLHRFTRVKAKLLEWSIEHLGRAIVVCGGIESGVTTDQQRADLLVKLTILKRLHDVYGLSLDVLLEQPISEAYLCKALGLSLLQFSLLKELIGYSPTAQSADWHTLEGFCKAARRLLEIGLSVEQAAHALLTRDRWETVAGELPPSIKSDEQIEKLLAAVQERLRSVVVVRPDVALETQAAEALSEIYDAVIADKLVKAIRDAGAEQLADRVERRDLLPTLHGDAVSRGARMLGEWSPLLTVSQAEEVITLASNLSTASRFEKLLNGVASRRRERELITEISEQCGLDEFEVIPLLTSRLLLDPGQGQPLYASEAFLARSFWADVSLAQPVPPSVTAAAMPRLHAWMDRVYRLIALGTPLAIDGELLQIAARVAVGSNVGINWRDMLASAPVNSTAWQNPQWQALLDLLWLQQPDQLSRPALGELLNRLAAPGAQVLDETLRPLTSRVNIDKTLVPSLVAQALSMQSNAISTLDLRNPGKLRLAFESLLLAKHIGADATQIARLINLADNALAGDTAKALLVAKLSGDDMQTSLQKIGDSLRRQRREALLTYHVAQIVGRNNSDKWSDAKALYEHFLIDHQMEPCFETTRIVEAVTAVQLFAQRILFGVESGLTAESEFKQRWTWMRNYRVWEANRKVFLFPENWLFPELRDDKSSSFKQLESALGQGELNQDLANQSFGRFLDDVAQMGQVQVLGMYEDISRDANGNILKDDTQHPLRRTLYVVGRTPNPPYAYFWRHCVDFGSPYMEWSPWQRIELDIQGDHVLPFVLGGNLHIVWPLTRRIKSDSTDEWEVKLAWSRYDGRSWTKANVSRDFWRAEAQPFSEEREGFSFRCEISSEGDLMRLFVYALSKFAGASKTIEPSSGGVPQTLVLDSSYWPSSENDLLAISKLNGLINGNFANLPATSLELLVDKNYPDLPAGIKEHFEVYMMAFGHWRVPPDAVHNLSGGDPLYERIRLNNEVFSQPDIAIQEHKTARDTNNTALKRAVFLQTAMSMLSDFLKRCKSQPGSIFVGLMQQLQGACSQRIVYCEAWIRVTAPSGKDDLLVLDGSRGSYTCLLDGQLLPLSPGQRIDIVRLGSQAAGSCHLTLTLNGDSFPSTTSEPVVAVPAGKFVTQTLRFEINGKNMTKEHLDSLNIHFESMKMLSLVSEFHLTCDDLVSRHDTLPMELLSQVEFSQPWMNGFQESLVNRKQAGYPFKVLRPGDIDITVFSESAQMPFWVVGAAASRSHKDLPLSWHYRESGLGCYVDLGFTSALPNSGVLVYPDSFREATLWRTQWSELQTLDDSLQQVSTFGAEALPIPEIGAAASWQEIISGALTFDARLPYACYNWEVFFHAPLLIADQLSKQHKFEDAERWLRYVFDPTSSNDGTGSKRFLKFRVFKDLDLNQQVIDNLTALAQVAGGFASDVDVDAVRKLIDRWQDRPFRPFLIARMPSRHVAFLWRTLFAYLDNLIAWADSLYRRDTRESINEATMLYVLAERILGRRPQLHQGKSNRPAHTYDQKISNWDEFANFWIDVGAQGYSNLKTAWRVKDDINQPSPGGMLYFCMPFNDKILSYWNIVDARLSNIRNCRNLEGVERKLPLMDAPIDPELLVRATATGLDLSDVIAGLYAPPPHYRFSILSARAAELANECKSLGAAMLSAIEKRDAEHLSQLRSSNEISLLKLVYDVRTLQITEAERNIEALRTSRKSLESRYSQYQRLLGKKDITLPKEQEGTGEESMLGRVDDGTSGLSQLGLIDAENKYIEDIDIAYGWTVAGGVTKGVAGATHTSASIVRAAMAGSADAGKIPAEILTAVGTGLSTVGDMFDLMSRGWQHSANKQSILGGHIRRRDEWAFQSNQTLKELQQIDKQILANQIRIEITQKELDNHLEQMEQAKAVDEVMRSKFSNVQLYEWMKTELSRLYFNAYRMAVDMARRAERAASRELGVKPLNIVRNDYWDSLRDGLLAGERLHQDLKRLEIAYLDQNRREYEMTKHVSLKRLNPLALLALKASGQCELEIPEWLHDMETPGHYMRRIKMVSVSVPCIVGPYASVNCKLTLLRNDVRHSTSVDGGYAKSSQGDDDRFTVRYGATESIVTSTARDDSGMFEPNFRDERYLPFEGAGASGRWRLEIPKKSAQFDFDTISDVILHIRFTARDGGDELRKHAEAQWVSEPPASRPVVRYPHLLSCRTDFSNEWNAAKSGAGSVRVRLEQSLLPYWMTALNLTIRKVSTLTWPLTDPANPQPVERWPAQTTGTLALGLNGTGVADLGSIPHGTEDVLIVLEVGNG